jgi:hypothetical protein
MTPIEKKIKNNKQLFEEKFVGRGGNSDMPTDKIKIEFRTYWESGWDNGKSFKPIVRTSGVTLPDQK